jgi:uncharacterized protein YjbI with pentapeptide repeats
MIKRELVKRWLTTEGASRLGSISDCLKNGTSLESVKGLEKYAGRWDLRGAQLSTLKDEKRIESGGHGVTQRFGSLKLKNRSIDGVDFSYADISFSWWERCRINNCLFEKAKAKEIWVYASDFSNCVFKGTNLAFSYLGENIGDNSGSYQKTEFIEANLNECIFCFPIISDCLFADCNLTATNFDGSRLKNCKFVGKVDSPWFRGYSTSAQKSILGIFHRVNPKKYRNVMENVDFSGAKLIGVSFSHEIDLTNCIFPSDESQYIVVRNLRLVYSKLREIIEKEWTGEYKRLGLGFIDTIYFMRDRDNQPMDIVDKDLLTDEGKDSDFGEKFFQLIRQVNSDLNQ